jgi:hypothetical protein
MSIGVMALRACLAVGLLGSAATLGGPAAAIEYEVSQGYSVTGLAMQMKPDEGGPVCFVAVTIHNGSGKDQVLEISLESDDGYSVTTFTGGPDRKTLKTGASETAEFKTLLRQLPKDLTISVRPAE